MGHEYVPLTSNSPQGFEQDKSIRATASREKVLLIIVLLQAVALVASVFILVTRVSSPDPGRPLLYSPAQVALEPQIKTFTEGLKQKTIYQGISDDVDRAWGELYNHTILKIPKSEAALLPNKTYPIKDEPGYYIIELDVFHQLHFLNKIRQALHKEHYVDDFGEEHTSHCIDSIRQYIMCNVDISVIVWQWNAQQSFVIPRFTQPHMCQNFDKLLGWARERRMHNYIDLQLFVEDDLPTPPVIY